MTQPPNLPPPVAKPGRSRLAIASLALALIALFIFLLLFVGDAWPPSEAAGKALTVLILLCFLASPIFGIASLIAIYRSHGKLVGRGMAIVSIWFWTIIMVAGVFLPGSGPVRPSNRIKCLYNLKQIDSALSEYYKDNNNRYPLSLSSLFPTYTSVLGIFQCPSARPHPMKGKYDEQLCSYRYIYYPDDSARKVDVDWMILAFDKSITHHSEGIIVSYMDGHINFTRREKLVATLEAMANHTKLSVATRDSVRKTLAEVLVEDSTKRESP